VTPEVLIGKLAEGIQQSELDTDAIATKFLDGELQPKDFIEQYLVSRKAHHVKILKKEELQRAEPGIPHCFQ